VDETHSQFSVFSFQFSVKTSSGRHLLKTEN
jgi:hypothetical protein